MDKLFRQFALIFVLLSLALNVGSCGAGKGLSDGQGSQHSPSPSTGPNSGQGSSAPDEKGPLSAWKLYQALDSKSNEAVLIQRAAMYVTNDKKEAEFNTASVADKKASVQKLMQAKNFQAIVDMLNKMSPVHRCLYKVLSSIDQVGFALSNEILEINRPSGGLGEDERFTEKSVNLLAKTYRKKWPYKDIEDVIRVSMLQYIWDMYDPGLGIAEPSVEVEGCTKFKVASKQDAQLTSCMNAIMPKITTNKETKDRILASLIHFFSIGSAGIAFDKDKKLGTNKFVFSILGIHRSLGYAKIALHINPSLLSDPETFTTPVAATYMENGNYGALAGRPWITVKEFDNGGGKADYEHSKIKNTKPGVLGLVMAADFMGRVKAYHTETAGLFGILQGAIQTKLGVADPSKDILAMTPDDIRNFMKAISPSKEGNHTMPEVHLPTFPFEKIDGIIVDQGIKDLVDKGHAALKYVPIKNIPKDKFIVVDGDFDEGVEKYSAPQ